jgi:hypothetical protein
MTRSSARRQNGNARMIVAMVAVYDAYWWTTTQGAFDADSARRFMPNASFRLFMDQPVEVNWPLAAELLNRKARTWLSGILLLHNVQIGVERGESAMVALKTGGAVSAKTYDAHRAVIEANRGQISRIIAGEEP